MGDEYNLPGAFIIKEPISTLLIFLSDVLRLLVALEPGLIQLVEAPALVLEGLGSQVLLIRGLTVVEEIEQRVCIYSAGLV